MNGRALPRYRRCFVCGDDNDCGMAMTWMETPGGAEGRYRGAERHCGYEGVLHGAMVAGLLDECVGWAAAVRARALCVTGELTVRYLKPLPVDLAVLVRGSADGPQEGKRYLRGTGEIVGDDGSPFATCSAVFFPLPPEQAAVVLSRLVTPTAGMSAADYLGWSSAVAGG